jgi:hypothetical protein
LATPLNQKPPPTLTSTESGRPSLLFDFQCHGASADQQHLADRKHASAMPSFLSRQAGLQRIAHRLRR